MTVLGYSLLANDSIQQYRLVAIGQDSKNFYPIKKVELSNTIGQLSSKAYTELRRQQMAVNTAKDAEEAPVELDQGYSGSEETASRILETVKGLIGGDSKHLNIIIDAVKKGFDDAQYTSGGKLPEISLKTRETVFAELDSWAESLNR